MTISFGSSGHSGAESHHYYRQNDAPVASDGLDVGDLWSDTTANVVKRCTSTSPVTFVSIEGGSAAHDLFSTTHGDVDETDIPAEDDVLTYNSGAVKWSAEPASGHGDHHSQNHAINGATHTLSGATAGHVLRATGATTFEIGQAQHGDLGGIGRHDHIPDLSKSITVEDPTNAEDISIFFINRAITITELRAVVRGTAPSVVWTIRHGTDRSAVGAEAVTGGTTTTSQTTGSDVTAFNDATIVLDSFVWLETTAKTGTVDELHITIFYTID